MKHIIVIGEYDHARAKRHAPEFQTTFEDFTSGTPRDLYGVHIRLSEKSEDFEVLFLRDPLHAPTLFEEAVLAIAKFYDRKVTIA